MTFPDCKRLLLDVNVNSIELVGGINLMHI